MQFPTLTFLVLMYHEHMPGWFLERSAAYKYRLSHFFIRSDICNYDKMHLGLGKLHTNTCFFVRAHCILLFVSAAFFVFLKFLLAYLLRSEFLCI